MVLVLAIAATVLACIGGDGIVPAPTPVTIDSSKTMDLGTGIRLVDVINEDAVDIGPDGELWLVNIRTGDSSQLTYDGHPKGDVAISADYVAWIDQRRKIPLPSYPVSVLAGDVFVRNRHTGEEKRITDVPASRHGLRMSGPRLVWQDNRIGLLEDRRQDFDIYAHDLEKDVEVPVAVAPGQQLMPAIHGDMVVWSDNRNRSDDTTSNEGCANCPDNPFDIYSYNLETAEGKPLVETGGYNGMPSIHGQLVAWQQFQDGAESAIVLLGLSTGVQRVIGGAGRGESRPLISDGYVVWAVKETCDVSGLPRSKGPTGVYAYALEMGETLQLSYDTEPNALLYRNTELVSEGCHWSTRQYAVSLD